MRITIKLDEKEDLHFTKGLSQEFKDSLKKLLKKHSFDYDGDGMDMLSGEYDMFFYDEKESNN